MSRKSGVGNGNESIGAVEARPSETDVAARAYQLYLECGGSHGDDIADWLTAERELASRRPSNS